GVFSIQIFAQLGHQISLPQLNGGKTAYVPFLHENGKHFFNDGLLALPCTQGVVQSLFYKENIDQGELARTSEGKPEQSVCDFIKNTNRFLKLTQSLCLVRHRLPIGDNLLPFLGNTDMVIESMDMF